MAPKEHPVVGKPDLALEVEQLKRRLDMFDQRFDNIDSMLSAVVQRVMTQPITLNTSCPRCGASIEIALMGGEKPTR